MIFFIIIICIIGLDQWTKKLALKNLTSKDSRPILNNKVYLTLHKNKGAALNIFENYPKLLKMITIPTTFLLVFSLLKILRQKQFILTKVSLALIIGGGIGNLIDRIKKGYVVDFFYFNFKKCPIFNIADFFIILGAIMLQFLFIFKKTPID